MPASSPTFVEIHSRALIYCCISLPKEASITPEEALLRPAASLPVAAP